jgi:ribosomal protein L39E
MKRIPDPSWMFIHTQEIVHKQPRRRP